MGDGRVRVFTLEDGWGWIFPAVDHWNAECVGWHVCKKGDRFAALEPIKMGLARLYGSTAAGAARGLALRMDHGTQYLSDHFTNQIKFWGIAPSYSFVAEPQATASSSGSTARSKNRSSMAVSTGTSTNCGMPSACSWAATTSQWLVEKNGFLSPNQARKQRNAVLSVRPAA